MMQILRHRAANAYCLSLFTAFYAAVFLAASRVIRQEGTSASRALNTGGSFWKEWCVFLSAGHQAILAAAMVLLTAAVIFLLILRRHPYDEYHAALLTQCLAVAAVLTLVAIAVFFVLVLNDPAFIIVKFTLFISIHWVTVVLSDLAYVLLCRWR